jgi:hypothetical protein
MEYLLKFLSPYRKKKFLSPLLGTHQLHLSSRQLISFTWDASAASFLQAVDA